MAVWEKFDPKESNALEDNPAEDGPAVPFGDPYSKLLSYRDFPSDPGSARACDPRLRGQPRNASQRARKSLTACFCGCCQ
jgi:hypothetical protein